MQSNGQANYPFTRDISVEVNEVGKWNRLCRELKEISNDYGVEFDTILDMFESVSCSKKHLRAALEKKTFTAWTALDDIGLQNGEDSAEYEHLLRTKGQEEIDRRKKFLGIK